MGISTERIEEVLAKYDYRADALVPILMDTQSLCADHYLTEATQRHIAKKLNLTYVDVYEVSSFYAALNKTPQGKFHIQVCDSSVCRVNKKDIIQNFLEEHLDIQPGQVTSDGLFSLEETTCFGACDISPAIRINKKVHGHLTIQKIKALLKELKEDIYV